ncbi:BrnT family toxin [Duganella sp. FT80W]|uniref:BrnT family toxin n=1 Tax=Duganella guangzhouensis TaxID=2666084 RepID=A0A6I2KYH6_9BURK|nr:BrnT family toxin [Duganella guangzhouensis]MRW89494.1 BrnT family toxin [Duganella guangzhouensis]
MHNQFNDIEFDLVKAQSNLRKHKVSFGQAEQVLLDPLAITTEDKHALGEQRFSTLGADGAGKILIVIHTSRGDRTRLISARKASKSEAEKYHAQGI